MIHKATMTVEIDLGEGRLTEHPGRRTEWVMRALAVLIEYTWDRQWGYWRVTSSTVFGNPVSGPCPGTHVYGRQDVHKPLWLVALEQQHYPKGTTWSRSTAAGR